MCTVSISARTFKSSPCKWDAEPLPVEAKVIFPGFFLARAIYSLKFFTPSSGITTKTFGKVTPIVRGAKSFCGSYGNFMRCGAIASGPIDPNKMTDPSAGAVAV